MTEERKYVGGKRALKQHKLGYPDNLCPRCIRTLSELEINEQGATIRWCVFCGWNKNMDKLT